MSLRVPAETDLSRVEWRVTLADPGGDLWSDPAFVESLERGRADVEAGRTYYLDTKTGVISPNPDWPKDGPPPKPPRNFVTMELVDDVWPA